MASVATSFEPLETILVHRYDSECTSMVSSIIAKQALHFQRTIQSAEHDMTAQEQDLDLIGRMSAGDEDAMRELYATYGQRLYAYALRLTNDPASAEDVVQETLVTVWRAAGKYRGEGRVLAWLLGIAHNVALKVLRRRSLPITDEMETNLASSEASPEVQAQASDQA